MEYGVKSYLKVLAIKFKCLKEKSNLRAETVGVITTLHFKPNKFIRFSIDDSTGTISCILWLNHVSSPYFARRSPQDVQLMYNVACQFVSLIKLGNVVRVRGKVGVFRGIVQLTVTDVVLERDPNSEILHWLECIRLARRVYRGSSSKGTEPRKGGIADRKWIFEG